MPKKVLKNVYTKSFGITVLYITIPCLRRQFGIFWTKIVYYRFFCIIVICITIPCLQRQIGVFGTKIDFAPPIFPYIYMELKLYKIYMNKTGKNTEEVRNTKLYHSSFGTIVMFITIPCFWRQSCSFPTQIDFTPPIFPYIYTRI